MTAEHFDVVIVGAGFAGIGMAMRLARESTHTFVVLERANDVGGTWRDNTYPGAACDIPSHLYSFSFRQKPDWSHVFARGPEIAEYLRDCVRSAGLGPSIRFGTELTAAAWDARQQCWHVTTSRGVFTARALVTAVGRLSEPRLPDISGLDTFTGEVMHTSRWNHDLDIAFAGTRVGVVGTGASAVQVVPEVARLVRETNETSGELVVFQQSAAWVIPRDDREYTRDEQRDFAADPARLDASREAIFDRAERVFAQRLGEPEALAAARGVARTHLEAQITDPALRAALTPDYELGCKRVLLSNDFYPALTEPHVTLEASALSSVDGRVVTAASGARYELDVLIFATGFHTTEPPFARLITGSGGERLSDHWARGMTAYASTVVHGYPNLFILDGPNASLGHNSAIHMIETQVQYVLGALDELAEHPDAALDVTADAETAYTAALDARAANTVWLTGGCSSWYRDPRSGRLTLLWPGTARSFREANGRFDAEPFDAEPFAAEPFAAKPFEASAAGDAEGRDDEGQLQRQAREGDGAASGGSGIPSHLQVAGEDSHEEGGRERSAEATGAWDRQGDTGRELGHSREVDPGAGTAGQLRRHNGVEHARAHEVNDPRAEQQGG
ncbi:NAD(P)/FAD-dependent oxidoreductase [Subtercola vilae]|uniref:flavin-containing monooxygenase n=1 Tax=Subtercola vilae TaxID=2056433 RepID=UPI002685F7C4